MTTHRLASRLAAGGGLAVAGLALLVAPASAHVGTIPSEAPAGSSQVVQFKVSHGCDGSPTTRVAIQIPEGVVSVKPQATPGWTIESTVGPITPYDNHGEQVTEGITEVVWSGGSLPDDQFMTFGLSVKLPDAAGETISFPTVQTCEQGETRWIEIAAEGGAEPESPAPAVTLTAADAGDGHGGAAEEPAGDGDTATSSNGSEVSAAAIQQAQDDADSASTFGIIGLSVGAVALAISLGTFAAQRKRTSA